MCDSYIGLDQEYTVDLVKVNQIIKNQVSSSSKKKDVSDETSGSVMININTSIFKSNEVRNDEEVPQMPTTFQMYSELTKKVFGSDNRQQLIASDGEGREGCDSESSFEFDVTADDIYDLTFF